MVLLHSEKLVETKEAIEFLNEQYGADNVEEQDEGDFEEQGVEGDD